MKPNESILVYSVTGLLVVILAVAILFGNEQGAQAQTQARGKALDELVGVNAASAPDRGTAETRLTPGGNAAGEGATPAKGPDLGLVQPEAPAPGNAASPPDNAPSVVPMTPLAMQSPVTQQPEPDLATQALMWLGDSKRDGDYRIVMVRKDDTFSELVQRWCGNLDQLEIAESLNEELNLRRLEPSTKVCLPWVDDAKLVAAHVARKQKQETEVKVVTEARNKGLDYRVKAGDKLWNIAAARVGQKNANQFIEEVKALNPALMADPSKLVVGTTIILPR